MDFLVGGTADEAAVHGVRCSSTRYTVHGTRYTVQWYTVQWYTVQWYTVQWYTVQWYTVKGAGVQGMRGSD